MEMGLGEAEEHLVKLDLEEILQGFESGGKGRKRKGFEKEKAICSKKSQRRSKEEDVDVGNLRTSR